MKLVSLKNNDEFEDYTFSGNIYKSFGKFKIPKETSVNFISRDSSLETFTTNEVLFFDDLEKYNLKLVPKDTMFGYMGIRSINCVRAESEFGEDIFQEYFKIENDTIISTKEFYAAMITKNIDVAKSDCFFYFLTKAEKGE